MCSVKFSGFGLMVYGVTLRRVCKLYNEPRNSLNPITLTLSGAKGLPGPWMSYFFGDMPYKYVGQSPQKEGHPGSW